MSLDGKQLRYLIGGDDSAQGKEDEITELGFDARDAAEARNWHHIAICST
jgi:hypothetical protein